MALGDGAMAPQMGTLVHSWAVLCTVYPACQGRWVAPLGLGDESQLPGVSTHTQHGDPGRCSELWLGWGGSLGRGSGAGRPRGRLASPYGISGLRTLSRRLPGAWASGPKQGLGCVSTFWMSWGDLTFKNNRPAPNSRAPAPSEAGTPVSHPLPLGVTCPESEGLPLRSLDFGEETGMHPTSWPGVPSAWARVCDMAWVYVVQEPWGPSRGCRAWSCRAGCSGHGQGLRRVEGVAMLGQEPSWGDRAKWQISCVWLVEGHVLGGSWGWTCGHWSKMYSRH